MTTTTTTTATTDEPTNKAGRHRSPGAAERSARRRVEYLERLARRAAFDAKVAAERRAAAGADAILAACGAV